VSLFDFSSFLPRRLDSQNLKQSIGNFGCLPVWVKNRRNRKNSRCNNARNTYLGLCDEIFSKKRILTMEISF
jgi:hypothetical protein